MPRFSSIVPHLQLKIAEKVDYNTQQELSLCSMNGKEIVNLVKFRTILDVNQILIYRTDIDFHLPNQRRRLLDIIRELCTEFPRLAVSKVVIYNFVFLRSLLELEQTFQFVNNKVELVWEDTTAKDKIKMCALGPQIVNIAKHFVEDGSLKEALISLYEFGETVEMDICINHIPDATLLQYQPRFLTFRESADGARIENTVNRIFQQWFQNARDIGCFTMRSDVNEPPNEPQVHSERTEALLFGLDSRLVWRCDQSESFYKDAFSGRTRFTIPVWEARRHLRSDAGINALNNLHAGDVAYSIDRGDKKLLVLVSQKCILAQEYDADYTEIIKTFTI